MNPGVPEAVFTDVELEGLLRRPLRHNLTAADRRAFAGRRVLITGAGGSVGSELARQIAVCGPDRLTLLDQSELNLLQIEGELRHRWPSLGVDAVLGDLTRPGVVRQACRALRPHAMYHAAAYKHVAMVERAICSAAAVNVLGTVRVVEAAREAGARFVLISSDKAAAPTSVMGATKRFAELAVLSQGSPAFRPIVVRFGNLIGSTGSVLAIMRARIRQGRSVPITNVDATRYFMTAAEAVWLVMKADLLARRAETFWLDAGEPVRIGDLAERLMAIEQRAGYPPVPIDIVGLRPGEKLREEPTPQSLSMLQTRAPGIRVAPQPTSNAGAVVEGLQRLRRQVVRGDALGVLETLAAVVDDFSVSPEAWAGARAQAMHADVPASRREARTA